MDFVFNPKLRYALRVALLIVLTNSGFGVIQATPQQRKNVDDSTTISLTLRNRKPDGDAARVVTREVTWNPRETAIVVCDMWNYHHSQNATERVAELAPRMNSVLEKAREMGVLIVHAPSSCLPYYAQHPARKRAEKAPTASNLPKEIETWCSWLPTEEQSAYPIDQSDGGVDDDPAQLKKWHKKLESQGLNPGQPWTRQIDTLKIDPERDVITDSGVENWNVQEQRGIKNVIVMGVHTNMCVLGRPFGLRQMARNGRNVVLMRDLTDTMYNPASSPFVSHFTGTDLILEHVEKYVCPTITSDQILGDGVEFAFQGDLRKHLVIVSAEQEYETGRTLPAFAKQFLGNDFRVSYVNADSQDANHLHGLDSLGTADMLLISVRRRALPTAQLELIRRFVASGKTVVGIRTASHAFALNNAEAPTGHALWPEFDQEVLGGNYHGHYGKKGDGEASTFVQANSEMKSHPILKGVPDAEFKVRSWLYKTTPLGPNTNVLMFGRVENEQPEPVVWTNTSRFGGKVFYTSLGHPDEFRMPEFQRLLRNGIYWAAGLPIPSELNRTSIEEPPVDSDSGKSAAKPETSIPNETEPVDGFELEPSSNVPSLKIPSDLELDLMLADPLVANPLYLNFDERGRLWVCQYRQYPWPAGLKLVSRDKVWRNIYDPPFAPPPPHAADSVFRGADRITIHEDTNGDGSFDKHKTFLDGLNFCTAALKGRGGVFVLNPPYLLYYADQNNDDIPDDPKPEILLSGFGFEDSHSLANNLRWGPDGWIYATQGSTISASVVRHIDGQPAAGELPIQTMGQNVWRYHPEQRRYEVFAEGGGNAFGVELDSAGRIYSGHNGGNTRGFHYVQGGYYLKNFGKHGSLSNPFAFSFFPAMKHEAVERFTHTFEIYESTELPERYHGKLFALDPHEHYLIHSEISPDGSSRQTHDIARLLVPGEGNRANWFSPVDIQTGPDGSLYIADWFSVQTNHYFSHEGQTNPDAGRILRLRGKTHRFLAPFDLNNCTTLELVGKYLAHPDRWQRETALRLLGDRKDQSVVPLLKRQIGENEGQLALDSLWALNATMGLDDTTVIEAIRHPNPDVRRWAIRLFGDRAESVVDNNVMSALVEAAIEDPNSEVRSQLASTAARLPAKNGLSIVTALLSRDLDCRDVHIPNLLWWAIEKHADDHETTLAFFKKEACWKSNIRIEGASIPECLIRRWALSSKPADFIACGELVSLAPEVWKPQLSREFVLAFEGRQIPHLPDALTRALADVEGIYATLLGIRRGDEKSIRQALHAVAKLEDPEANQILLIQALGDVHTNPAESVPVLLAAVSNATFPVKNAAIVALQNFDDPGVGQGLIEAYSGLPNEAKITAQATLASRTHWANELLKAIDEKVIDSGSIEQDTVNRIRLHQSEFTAALVDKHFPECEPKSDDYNQRVESYTSIILDGQGVAKIGQDLYYNKANCGKCHTIFGKGGDIGPDLTTYHRGNIKQMLLALVNPGAEIREGYEAFKVATNDGQLLVGFKVSENDQLLVIRGADGQNRSVSKDDIDEIGSSHLSIMPLGLLDPLSDQELRDLFAFLSCTTPPF